MSEIYLETYGCQMNEYDSDLVKTLLKEHSFCDSAEKADVVLFNTCAVRENAFNKIYARIGDVKFLKKTRKTKIGILGCMAQNLKDRLLDNGNVDFVVGPDRYRDLPALIEKGPRGKKAKMALGFDIKETYSDISPDRKDGVNAHIVIMRGCDNFCSFCVVPFTRGRERSRTLESVVQEAKIAVDQGYKQVTLLGQNVNSYRSESSKFVDLMDELSSISGLERVRFTSPHPKDFPIELLELIRDRDNLCNHIHLPLQSGNSEILKQMRRGYTQEEYLDIAEQVRSIIPGVFVTTDIIVGFPGEKDSHYQDTLAVMEKVKFESSYIFKYSPREGTVAKDRFADDVSEEDKKHRIVELNAVQNKHLAEVLEKSVGKEVRVLIERESTQLSEKQCQGRTEGGLMTVIPQDGSLKKGMMVDVLVGGRTSHVLLGASAVLA